MALKDNISLNLFMAGSVSGIVGILIVFLARWIGLLPKKESLVVSSFFGIYVLTSLICFVGSYWAYHEKHLKYVKFSSIVALIVGLTGFILFGIFGLNAMMWLKKYRSEKEGTSLKMNNPHFIRRKP